MNNIFERIAGELGTTPEEVRAEIQTAIDAAWNDPDSAAFREQLFPEGKPAPELFVQRLAEHV